MLENSRCLQEREKTNSTKAHVCQGGTTEKDPTE